MTTVAPIGALRVNLHFENYKLTIIVDCLCIVLTIQTVLIFKFQASEANKEKK